MKAAAHAIVDHRAGTHLGAVMPAHGSVMLWTADLQAWQEAPAAWLADLDDAERAQCQRFRRPDDRLAYAAAHALLRRALGASLGLPAASLRFARDALGKPFLQPPGNIDFSLSHTTGMVAVALSSAGPVGVDVEALDRTRVPTQDWGAFGLSAAQERHLATLAGPQQNQAFLALWTAREAVSKADGRGLALPLQCIQVDLCGKSATVLALVAEPPRHWRLWCNQPSGRHVLALAWQPNGSEMRQMGTLL